MTALPDDRLQLTATAHVTAVAEMRNAVTEFTTAAGAPRALADTVKLAVSEVLTNVVMHAYIEQPTAGPLVVEAWRADDALIVLICDEGRGMKPRADSPGLGLGLALVARLADDFRVEDRPDAAGTRVAMKFSLDGSGSGLAR